jgi:ParB/RepB/Spo0J family partition protein
MANKNGADSEVATRVSEWILVGCRPIFTTHNHMTATGTAGATAEDEQSKIEGLLRSLGVTIKPAVCLEPSLIQRMPDQPRVDFDTVRLNSLQTAIKEMGQLVDGIVRALTAMEIQALPPDQRHVRYQLVDGERRWLACKALKRGYSAKLAEGLTPQTQFVLSIALNFNREDHNPLEKILAVRRLQADNWTIKDIAVFFGMSEVTIYGYQRLLDLHPDILALLGPPTPEDKRIGMTVAREFLDLKPEAQLEVYRGLRPKAISVQIVRRAVRQKGEACIELRRPGAESNTRDSRDILRLLQRLGQRSCDATSGVTNKEIHGMNLAARRQAAQHLVAVVDDVQMLLSQLAFDFKVDELPPLEREE